MEKGNRTGIKAIVCALIIALVITMTPFVSQPAEAATVQIAHNWPLKSHSNITGKWNEPRGDHYHYGIDIASSSGTSVYASAAGTVEEAKTTSNGYGNRVLLKHSDGTYTLYAHLSSRSVAAGDKVNQGEVIGKAGSTGDSTGPHLHYGIYLAKKYYTSEFSYNPPVGTVDPLKYLGKNVTYTFKFATGTTDTVTNMPSTQQIAEGKFIYLDKLSTPKRAGYEFIGWKNSKDDKVVKIYLRSKGDRTLTAQWKKLDSDVISHSVSYTSWSVNEPSVTAETKSSDGKTKTIKEVQTLSAHRSYSWYCDCKKSCFKSKGGATCSACGTKTNNFLSIYSVLKIGDTGYSKNSNDNYYKLAKTISESSPGKFEIVYAMYYGGTRTTSFTATNSAEQIWAWQSENDPTTLYRVKTTVYTLDVPETHTHSYSTTKVAATCTAQGYTLYKCSCGESYKDNYVSALGHSWNNGVVTKAATANATGVRTYTCTRCNATKTETIPMLTHTHKYTSKVVKPTCTERGYTLHKCSCGESYKDNYVSALGHDWNYGVGTKATLEKNGKAVYTCSNCGMNTGKSKTIYAVDTVKLSWTSTTYNGKTKKPTVTVTDTKGNKLTNGTDYTVTYPSGRKNVGSYKVTVKGKGNYSFTKTLTFKIKAAGIDYAKLSWTSTTYNGNAKKPGVTVVDKNGNTLTNGTDYTVTYPSGRKNVGSYKVTVKGKGNYSFTKTLTFKINPPKATLSSATKKSSTSITVKWKKVSNVTGYQIKYITGDTTKTIKVKGSSTVSKVLKELKKGKTYKVSIRTYKTVDGTTYYSGYSTAKSVNLSSENKNGGALIVRE